jgi:hypothetical protein
MKLPPLAAAAWTFKHHLAQILFYVSHRITNDGSEDMNMKSQTNKQKW